MLWFPIPLMVTWSRLRVFQHLRPKPRLPVSFPIKYELNNIPSIYITSQSPIVRKLEPLDSTSQELSNDILYVEIQRADYKLRRFKVIVSSEPTPSDRSNQRSGRSVLNSSQLVHLVRSIGQITRSIGPGHFPVSCSFSSVRSIEQCIWSIGQSK